MAKQKFSDWVNQKLENPQEPEQRHITWLHKTSGIARATIDEGLKDNRWTWRSVEQISKALGQPMRSDEEAEGTFELIWRRGRTVKPKNGPNLMEVLAEIEAAQAKREVKELIPKIFDAVCSARPAVMATIAAGRMPSLLDSEPEFDDLRNAVYRAQKRGLMVLFIAPDKIKVTKFNEYGLENIPQAEDYTHGFNKYFKGANARIVQCGDLDITGCHYTVTLIGETTDYSHFPRRIVERGPASRGNVWVVPWADDFQVEIAHYVAEVVRRHLSGDGDVDFARAFLRRLGGFRS